MGETVWERFSQPKKQTIWYYSSLAAVFRERLPGQLAEELHEIVEVLAGDRAPTTVVGDGHRSICRGSSDELTRLSQLAAETGYSTGKNASPIKGGDPKTWRSEDQVA